jgi:sulfonate transport system ATP-binding protein
MLKIDVTRKTFPPSKEVFCNLQIEQKQGEFLSILGKSGSGKTTLLKMIAGLDTNYDGHIYINDQIVDMPIIDTGVVFQESRLLPWFTVYENIEYGLPSIPDKRQAQQKVFELMKAVGMENKGELLPYQLSGGMKRRVALARALICKPKLLLLDEPFTALDLGAKHSLQDLLKATHTNRSLTSILITHDIEEAAFLSDRVLIIGGADDVIQSVPLLTPSNPSDRTSPEFGQNFANILSKVINSL